MSPNSNQAQIAPAESNSFGFQSSPKPVPDNGHLMYEKKIVKGSQFQANNQEIPIKLKKKSIRVSTPSVPGRQHIALQTDIYLEEIVTEIPVAEIALQTDAFMDRPPTPLYVPIKDGVDATTQIYPGELFDFDVEIEPILEVLVGKVIEQSWIEVLEEEELADMKTRQIAHELRRNAEFAHVQRLEEAEKRKEDEKHRRMAEQERVFAEKVVFTQKLAAQATAKALLKNMIPSIMDSMVNNQIESL